MQRLKALVVEMISRVVKLKVVCQGGVLWTNPAFEASVGDPFYQ